MPRPGATNPAGGGTAARSPARQNWPHKPHTVEMHRVRPAVEAGLMQPAEAAALKMKPVLE